MNHKFEQPNYLLHGFRKLLVIDNYFEVLTVPAEWLAHLLHIRVWGVSQIEIPAHRPKYLAAFLSPLRKIPRYLTYLK